MKCMRCGTAIASDHVFCDTCSEDMKRHPVDPATPVVIPQRPTTAPAKQSHKKVRKPEEIIRSLRSWVTFLLITVVALLVALGITKAFALDGGQTATIIANDKLINRPTYGTQRQISDIIYFATALPDGG